MNTIFRSPATRHPAAFPSLFEIGKRILTGLYLALFLTTISAQGQGALSNGESHNGAIAAAGESDTWTIDANNGDRIVVQFAKLTGGAGFTPRMEAFSPDGFTLGSATNGVAGRLDLQAHVTGTFTVVITDDSGTGTGTYSLQYANVPQAFTVPVGDEGGALSNGMQHDGRIALGDLDMWTFTGVPGGRAVVQIAKQSGGAGFTPQIEVFSPSGARIGISSDSTAARLDLQTDSAGTYTVLVSDKNQIGTGSYGLQLAQVPTAFTVPIGDEGGALANGESHVGTITVGDVDMWTVTANAGDRLVLQLGETSGGASFTPQVELFSPDGTRLSVASDSLVARLDAQVPTTGTYTVLVSDANATGTGNYQLQLAQVPESFTVPAGDEGGALADNSDTNGTIAIGDLDLWSFTATAGDLITIQATELTGGATFAPMIELFTPDGTRKTFAQDASVATIEAAIETTGTYTVLISDATRIGAGTYQLHLTRGTIGAAGANVLVNGGSQTGTIASAGAQDTWTLTATSGETIFVSVGELTSGSPLVPRVKLLNPDGIQLATAYAASAAEIAVRATNSGTFSVVVDDNSASHTGTGDYRISLIKTGSPIVTNPSDEGGPLVNGTTYQGTINVGEVDAWTVTANAGETFFVAMGETTTTSLTPILRIYGPDGTLLKSDYTGGATEIAIQAAESGTFLVIAGDNAPNWAGSGNYRLTVAKTGSAPVISPTDDGGPLVNGTTYQGTIDLGNVDAWTVNANAGETIFVAMGETTTTTLTPILRIYGPDGTLLKSDYAGSAAEIAIQAPECGRYLVIAGDNTPNWNGSGNYRLIMAKTGSAPVISPTDEGGPLVNGTTYQGTIDVGDVDAWTVTANAGETIFVAMGETTTTSLTPAVRVYGPNGNLLDWTYAGGAAEVAVRASESGSFLILAGDYTPNFAGSGNYRLTVAKTGSAPVISPTDDGGPLVNGTTYQGTIDLGNVDAWTLTASAGDSIIVRMGETTTTGLTPILRIYDPYGKLLDSAYAGSAAEVAVRAAEDGTYLVIAGDNTPNWAGSGNYRLTMAKTGSPLVISPSDEGGQLPNGTQQIGAIDTGDIDTWTFTANAGDNIIVRMGETTTATLTSQLRLYGPDGTLLDAASGGTATEVSAKTSTGGTILLVASDLSNGWAGVGNYRLTLALMPETFTISAGDEGGALPQTGSVTGEITTGDVDMWRFEANAGNVIDIQMAEQNGTALTPQLRLYDVNGQLLSSKYNASLADIPFTVTQSGLYTVVAADFSNGYAGTGTYQLTVTGLPEQGKQLRYEYSSATPDSLLINWPSELTGYVLQQSPVLPGSNWTDVQQAPIDNRLNVRLTIQIPSNGNMFFRLRPPTP